MKSARERIPDDPQGTIALDAAQPAVFPKGAPFRASRAGVRQRNRAVAADCRQRAVAGAPPGADREPAEWPRAPEMRSRNRAHIARRRLRAEYTRGAPPRSRVRCGVAGIRILRPAVRRKTADVRPSGTSPSRPQGEPPLQFAGKPSE